jgi:succinate dehydrogenase / fumarate reductase iron-sulfur subunit
VVELRSVFLVKGPDSAVTALDSTCTHLGCRVSWDSMAGELRCPCHGGAYDRTGEVKSGPPPRALARLNTKIEGDGILVQV